MSHTRRVYRCLNLRFDAMIAHFETTNESIQNRQLAGARTTQGRVTGAVCRDAQPMRLHYCESGMFHVKHSTGGAWSHAKARDSVKKSIHCRESSSDGMIVLLAPRLVEKHCLSNSRRRASRRYSQSLLDRKTTMLVYCSLDKRAPPS